MQSTESLHSSRTVCVSVHDVAPQTWAACRRLLLAVRAVADVPLTLLVVPAWHGDAGTPAADYERFLEDQLARGHELALHGYTHLDPGTALSGWRNRYLRRVYTLGEGEFAALDTSEAIARLARGRDWFERRGWPLHGFVAPAWLMGAGAWRALRHFPFQYTTTLMRFYCLRQGQSLFAPSLVYSSRNDWGRACSRAGNTVAEALTRELPLLRLGLHPRDAGSARTIAHFQGLLEKLLSARRPLTKTAFAASWHWAGASAAGTAGVAADSPIVND